MIDRILTVGGITLLSRVTGFLRDIMLAAVLGAGPVADATCIDRAPEARRPSPHTLPLGPFAPLPLLQLIHTSRS